MRLLDKGTLKKVILRFLVSFRKLSDCSNRNDRPQN